MSTPQFSSRDSQLKIFDGNPARWSSRSIVCGQFEIFSSFNWKNGNDWFRFPKARVERQLALGTSSAEWGNIGHGWLYGHPERERERPKISSAKEIETFVWITQVLVYDSDVKSHQLWTSPMRSSFKISSCFAFATKQFLIATNSSLDWGRDPGEVSDIGEFDQSYGLPPFETNLLLSEISPMAKNIGWNTCI